MSSQNKKSPVFFCLLASIIIVSVFFFLKSTPLCRASDCPEDRTEPRIWCGRWCRMTYYGVEAGVEYSYYCSAEEEEVEQSETCSDGGQRIYCPSMENPRWIYTLNWFNQYEYGSFAGSACDSNGDGTDDGFCYVDIHTYGCGVCENGNGDNGDVDTTCFVRDLTLAWSDDDYDCSAEGSIDIPVGESFDLSYEFWGTGPNDFPFEVRTAWMDGTRLQCDYADNFPEGQWHSETRSVSCPAEAGTYGFRIKCYGANVSNSGKCNLSDSSLTCSVNCIEAPEPPSPPVLEPRPSFEPRPESDEREPQVAQERFELLSQLSANLFHFLTFNLFED